MRLTKIKLQRLELGVLQIQLSRRARIARCRLSEIENGHVEPRPDELARIAKALGVGINVLVPESSEARVA